MILKGLIDGSCGKLPDFIPHLSVHTGNSWLPFNVSTEHEKGCDQPEEKPSG